MWDRNSLQQSAKEFFSSLGKWGWIVGGFLVLTIITAILPLLGVTQIPVWAWVVTGFITIILAAFISFHTVRIERDELIERAKPKLMVTKEVESLRGKFKEKTIGLEISNIGSDDAISCKGILQMIEFAEDDGHQSLFRWPQPRMLKWADSDSAERTIGSTLSVILDVMHRDNNFSFYFTYSNPEDRDIISVPTDKDILLVVAVSSKDAVPFYSVCYFDVPGGIGAWWTFKIISANIQKCPTIVDCRAMLKQYKAAQKTDN
jgi:hypothetical protein